MALTTSTDSMAVIAALDDEPNDTGGLTASQLKAKFDEAATALQTYINDTHIPELDAEHIPYQYGGGTTIKDEMDSIVAGGVATDSITAAMLKSDSVTTAKIADGNVTTNKIDDAAVTRAKMETGVAIITSGSYIGTGTYGSSNKTRITFSKGVQPKLVIASYVVLPAGISTVIYGTGSNGASSSNAKLTVTWEDTYVEWYDSSDYSPSAAGQLNTSSTTYLYLEVYA
jgi:hypothetical protein